MVNADISGNVSVTLITAGGSSIEYVVIGLKPAASSNFYDWGRATPSNSNGTWTRTPQMPTVNPAPVCTNGVSSKVMWEVKYLIRLTSGVEIQGVLPSRIARVFTGKYCPTPIDTVVPIVVSGTGSINRTSGTAGSEFIVTFRATDDVGVNDISGIIRNANGEVVTVRGSNQRSSGTALDGIWTVTVTVPTGTPLGQYSIFGRAQDLGNNAGTPNLSSEVLIGAIQVTG